MAAYAYKNEIILGTGDGDNGALGLLSACSMVRRLWPTHPTASAQNPKRRPCPRALRRTPSSKSAKAVRSTPASVQFAMAPICGAFLHRRSPGRASAARTSMLRSCAAWSRQRCHSRLRVRSNLTTALPSWPFCSATTAYSPAAADSSRFPSRTCLRCSRSNWAAPRALPRNKRHQQRIVAITKRATANSGSRPWR
jgi:hypothetical protein